MKRLLRILLKTLKITSITIAVLLFLMFLFPYCFPTLVSNKVKEWANSSIEGELNFSKARLSFFNHFPSLTLTLYDFSLKGSAPFKQDTLIASKELSLGIDLSTVFSKKIRIDEIYVTSGNINIQANEKGEANYNVYKSSASPVDDGKPETDTGSASLRISKIVIEKTNLVYNDKSLPMFIKATNLNYTGKGRLKNGDFKLKTSAEIGSFDFFFDNKQYVASKKVKADLVTRINTNSLALTFEKNDLVLNRLPFKFTGKFEFLKDGYDMNFDLRAKEADLYDALSALPAEYMPWLDKLDAKGKTDITASLVGKYIAAENKMPNLLFNLKIRDGYMAYEKAPVPLKNIYLDFETRLPSLNMDSLSVDLDSLFFNINNDRFSTVLKVKGINNPYIYAKANGELDLEQWCKATGFTAYDLKGKYAIQANAEGQFATKVVTSGTIRKRTDTVIASIPSFNIHSSLENGSIRYTPLPETVKLSFNLDASCKDHNYQHTNVSLNHIDANVLGSFIKGYIKLNNISGAMDFVADANLNANVQLNEIKKYYPLDSLELGGKLSFLLQSKGPYNAAKKKFPSTTANIQLADGFIQTKYYPHPIEKINIQTGIKNISENTKDITIEVQPVSFEFESHPFAAEAVIKNLEAINYDVKAHGTLDIGKIYRVFAIKGYNVDGSIKADIALKGSQADIMAKRYNNLHNKGHFSLQNISLTTEIFPKPFVIKSGSFRFNDNSLVFEQCNAVYGKSDISMNGSLDNIVNYALSDKAVLKGNFNFNSNYLMADELMAFSGSADTLSKAAATAPPASTGVIIIPSNLDLTFNATAKKIDYNGLTITDGKGQMMISNGKLILKETGFTLINAPVTMDATYTYISPVKAAFDYHINAKEFDIRKAYNEVKIFHDLASSAGKLSGIVSLDYQLSGKLNENMMPVYPSLKGGGVLSIKEAKVQGFKLMSAVSKATNRDSLNNPKLSKVDIKTKIANNIITLERTKLKIFGFRPRFEGQISFDSKLNLSGRLGLPPFGIIGIPFSVTGTQDNPKVKLRRAKEGDKLEETPDEEDMPAAQQQAVQ